MLRWATLATAIAFLITWPGTGVALHVLRRRAILDHPNERSSHSIPTPKGGGLVVTPAVLIAWLVVGDETVVWPAAAAACLAVLSWVNDLRGLSPPLRLAAHGGAVALVFALVPLPGPVFQGLLPPALDLVLSGLVWIWFVNLFNFMDGIDGITGVETASLGLGFALVGGVMAGRSEPAALGFALAAAAAGFLVWNWHPARIFLGDVGSVPLGFLAGWLLLGLAARGEWKAAVVLPLYYLADATVTLIRRALRGERVWHAHRQHFYQQAVRKGMSHAAVARAILTGNLVLIVLATLPGPAWLSLAGATLVVILLMAYLRDPRGPEIRP